MKFDKETQTRILRVAGDRSEGKNIDEVDERIAFIMDMHPEFDSAWGMGEMAIYPMEIEGKVVNPFVHTVLHVIVDKQIEDETPEFVGDSYSRLVSAGVDSHEALHSLIAVYADIYFGQMRKGDMFSNVDYQERLRQIAVQAEEAGD